MREPASGELIPTNLSCVACKGLATVCLLAEQPIRAALAGLTCPHCKSLGVMRLARPLLPDAQPRSSARIGEGPSDELGDEELHDHRLSIRNFPR